MVTIPTPMRFLKWRGLKIGKGTYIDKKAYIDWHYARLITIEDGVKIAPGAMILGHDGSTLAPLGYQRIGPVRIGKRAFIGANSIILPGADIGAGSIIGAGSVIYRMKIPPNSVVMGNPARIVDTIEGQIARYTKKIPA